MLLPIHIVAGGVAIVLGYTALAAKKGGTIHRRAGLMFVYAMLAMATTAAILGLRKGLTDGNVLAAVLTAYFVVTALTTVRPASRWTARINAVALAFAVVLAILSTVSGINLIDKTGVSPGGVPFRTVRVMSFVLATVLTLAAIGDVRMMRSDVRGPRRLRRHLWRMCFALFIAAGSFFSIRERVEKVLPDAFATGPMRLLPIVVLFGAMFYWLWRVRSRSSSVVR